MRLCSSSENVDLVDIKQLSKWIIRIGDSDPHLNENGFSGFYIPDDLLIHECVDPLLFLVEFTYPDLLLNMYITLFSGARNIGTNFRIFY